MNFQYFEVEFSYFEVFYFYLQRNKCRNQITISMIVLTRLWSIQHCNEKRSESVFYTKALEFMERFVWKKRSSLYRFKIRCDWGRNENGMLVIVSIVRLLCKKQKKVIITMRFAWLYTLYFSLGTNENEIAIPTICPGK